MKLVSLVAQYLIIKSVEGHTQVPENFWCWPRVKKFTVSHVIWSHTHTERDEKKKKNIQISFLLFLWVGSPDSLLIHKTFSRCGFCVRAKRQTKKMEIKNKNFGRNSNAHQLSVQFFFIHLSIYRIMYYYYFKNRKWKGGNWVRQKKTEMLDIFYSEGYSERTAVIIICRYILVYTLWIIWGIVDRSWTSILPPVIPREKNKKQMRNFYLFNKNFCRQPKKKKKGKFFLFFVCDDVIRTNFFFFYQFVGLNGFVVILFGPPPPLYF